MRFFLLVLLWCLAPLVQAQPRLAPDPLVVELSKGTSLSLENLIRLSYLLGGSAPAEAENAVSLFKNEFPAYQKWLVEKLSTEATPEKLGEHLLEYLHFRYLKRYSEFQTRVDVLFNDGRYNCVSSSLLYMIFARQAGLEVQAVATKTHVFCLVLLPDRQVDVETTNRYGWDPGKRTEFLDSFGNATGFAYVPPGNYKDRKTIDDRGLLGLLLQNRMAEFQRSGRQEEAVGLAFDRNAVEKIEDLTGPTEAFVNYMAILNSRKNYELALDRLALAHPVLGTNAELQKLAAALVNNQVLTLLAKKEFEAAGLLTDRWGQSGLLPVAQWRSIHENIAQSELILRIKELPWQEAHERVDATWRNSLINDAKRLEFLTFIYGKEAQKRASTGGNWEAIAFLRGLPTELTSTTALKKGLEVFIHNHAVEIHNQFASLFNNKKLDQAQTLLEEGLRRLPGNQLLQQDLTLLKKSR